MAILLVAFVSMGIVPGPQMLISGLDLVFSMVWIIVIANLLTTLIGLAISSRLARLPALSPSVLIPMVLSVCFLGAFATRGLLADVVVAAIFGGIGYAMDKYDYSRANFVIAMVLAEMIERNLHISLGLYGNLFVFTRPITLVMFIFILFTTALPFIRRWRRRQPTAHGDFLVLVEQGNLDAVDFAGIIDDHVEAGCHRRFVRVITPIACKCRVEHLA